MCVNNPVYCTCVFTLIAVGIVNIWEFVQVVMDREELLGEELDLILDKYPAGTPVHLVEDEEEPGELQIPDAHEFLTEVCAMLVAFCWRSLALHNVLVADLRLLYRSHSQRGASVRVKCPLLPTVVLLRKLLGTEIVFKKATGLWQVCPSPTNVLATVTVTVREEVTSSWLRI